MLARQPDAELRLYDVLRESFGRDERTGIHLSSLLTPLKTYWERKLGKPPLDNAQIGYFSAGRGHEDIVTRLLASDFESTPEEEIDGIHLRPDFIALTDRIVPKGSHVEMKTRRSNLPKTDSEAQTVFDSYRAQVRGYMALKRQTEMYLMVLSLLEGKSSKDPLSQSQPVFAVYKETMNEDELAQTRADLQQRKTLLEVGAYALLPLCPSWQCGKFTKTPDTWLYVKKCPYYDACEPWNRDKNRGLRSQGRPEQSAAE